MEALEDRTVPTTFLSGGVTRSPGLAAITPQMTYGNGPIIPKVQVETVYYGSAWTDPKDPNNPELRQEANDMDKFFADITASSYMDGLGQYYQVVKGVKTSPARGQFLKRDPVNTTSAVGTTPSDNQVGALLQQEIKNKNLDPADANKLYVVMLPPGVRSTGDYNPVTKTNLSGGGHHNVYQVGGTNIYFVVIDSALDNFKAAGQTGNESHFEHLTEVASHELAEAVSNPMTTLSPAWTGAFTDATGKVQSGVGAEIGDITQGYPSSTNPLSVVDGYLVQKYWSNKDGTSIAPGGTDYQDLKQVPGDLSVAHFTLTSLQQGAKTAAEFQIVSLTPTAAGQATFYGYWFDATSNKIQTVTGTLAVKGRTLSLTVKRADNTTVFNGTLSSPNGNWKAGVEMRSQNADTGAADYFGVQDGGSLLPAPASTGHGPVQPPTTPGKGTPVVSTHANH
jgi:hypothetical protein